MKRQLFEHLKIGSNIGKNAPIYVFTHLGLVPPWDVEKSRRNFVKQALIYVPSYGIRTPGMYGHLRLA